MKYLGLMVLVLSMTAFADETVSEKVVAGANSASRAVKKGAHRTSEALCMKGDLKCAGDKISNRAEEAKDATVDGAEKLENIID
ncbi:MAG: hypothetical protein H0V66_12265 [Bdellovibrionales bacterium]|nr:hypothetical protein [Bdellovibrionales bacterium]